MVSKRSFRSSGKYCQKKTNWEVREWGGGYCGRKYYSKRGKDGKEAKISAFPLLRLSPASVPHKA